ncbi:hypothetical protein BGZ51_002551 [Haplosporangium sp. Z 767]|nr:hypothetical protein BGZ51_002551 [Haplosporangium sp. Z 767]KAF9193800.1 hypothetical protein BGZ50_007093 [Haplosporangium sp. Z 11]
MTVPTYSPALPLSPCLTSYSKTTINNHSNITLHSRSNSESLTFTPPLSPTEEQLLAFLIPDIEPSELAAYLSAPATPILSDVSCLIAQSGHSGSDSNTSSESRIETVYPSPVCAAAAATVVAINRLDSGIYPSMSCDMVSSNESMNNTMTSIQSKKKRSSVYAFMDSEDEEEEAEESDEFASPVYVMSTRNTRKRLMLEQAFVSPDEQEDHTQNCYAQIFQGALSNELDTTLDLSSTLAYDLVLV